MLNNLSNYDESKAIVCSNRKMLLYDLKNKKVFKKFVIRETGNIIGVFKKNK